MAFQDLSENIMAFVESFPVCCLYSFKIGSYTLEHPVHNIKKFTITEFTYIYVCQLLQPKDSKGIFQSLSPAATCHQSITLGGNSPH